MARVIDSSKTKTHNGNNFKVRRRFFRKMTINQFNIIMKYSNGDQGIHHKPLKVRLILIKIRLSLIVNSSSNNDGDLHSMADELKS